MKSPPLTAADIEREREVLAAIIRADNTELQPNLALVLRLHGRAFTDPNLVQIAGAVQAVRDQGQDPVNVVTIGRLLHGDTLLALDGVMAKADTPLPEYLAEQEAAELLKGLPAEVLSKARSEQPASDPWLELVEDGAELQSRKLPPLVQIAEGILAELSKLSVVSSAKCYKTWLTIHLALCISHGIEFLGRATTRRRVLYVNLELKQQTFTRRLQAIAEAIEITIDPKWFSHLSLRGKLAGLTVHEIVSRILAVARALQAGVIVIDPLFKLNIEGEENSSRDQTVFCNELDRITTEGKCTAIFNDHSGKGNQSEKDPLDVIRGSSAKGGDLDAAMVLRKHEIPECFRVDLIHRELPPVEPFCIGWRYPLMELRPDLSPDAMKKAKAGRRRAHDPEALCAAIAEHNSPENPISISAWAKAAGITRSTLADYLPGLRAKGWIATTGEGSNARQYLLEKGTAAARRGKEQG